MYRQAYFVHRNQMLFSFARELAEYLEDSLITRTAQRSCMIRRA